MGMSVDISEFSKAIDMYQEASGKDIDYIMRKQSKNVLMRAIQFTPKADKAKIEAEMNQHWHKGTLASNLAAIRLKKRGIKNIDYKMLNEEGRKIIAARKRSIGYIKAGWHKALKDLGGNPRMTHEKSLARFGRAEIIKTSFDYIVNAYNYSTGADKVGLHPLVKAVDYVSQKLVEHSNKLLQKRALQFFKG